MQTISEIERIVQALCELPGVRTVTRGWPRQEQALPCAAVQLVGERGVARWDDAEYLTELTYYVRCFARTAGEADALAAHVRKAMEALGYDRDFAWEEADERVHQRAERYKTVI